MKWLLLHTVLFTCFALCAQDTVYLLDGTSQKGQITEISPDYITLDAGESLVIPREKVLLLEFRNGSTEMINAPTRNVVYNSTAEQNRAAGDRIGRSGIENCNMLSLNTMALCNADVSLFYERLIAEKKLGVGVMGAYNFNRYASFQNFFISALSNSKKNYDLGFFGNYYLRDLDERTAIHFGVMIKYLNFSYSKAIEEKVVSGSNTATNIKYQPATGSQLATILNFGTATQFDKNIFIKTLIGIGGFNLRGDYRQQYNYFLNKNATQNGTSTTNVNRGFLLKIYLGFNVGYYF